MRISDWSSDVCSSDLEQHQRFAVLLGMQFALAADPGEVAGGSRATAHQLTVRILQELGVADGVMTPVLLAAALGAAGPPDQYLRGEQRIHGTQVARPE